ncbi:unnamed protein product, partial [Discosporangium mesarthrocarpum]
TVGERGVQEDSGRQGGWGRGDRVAGEVEDKDDERWEREKTRRCIARVVTRLSEGGKGTADSPGFRAVCLLFRDEMLALGHSGVATTSVLEGLVEDVPMLVRGNTGGQQGQGPGLGLGLGLRQGLGSVQ